MITLFLFLIAAVLPAQVTYTFIEQPVAPTDGVSEYGITACNTMPSQVRATGKLLFDAAVERGLRPLMRGHIQTLARDRSTASLPWRAATAGKIGLFIASGFVIADKWKVREDALKVGLPSAAFMIDGAERLRKYAPKIEIPENYVPVYLDMLAGECREFVVWTW